MREIVFSGGSHYGAGALKSVQTEFDRVYILKDNDEEILELKRPADELIDDFDSVDCPVVFLGGHAGLITEKQLSRKKYINVHGALLPKYRGMHPTFWAIMNGETELGVTYHIVDSEMDHGPIIKQFAFPYYTQTVGEINKEIDDIIAENTGWVLRDYLDEKITPIAQDDSKAIWGCRRNLDDCLVDFTWDNLYLRRLLNALTSPYPLPRLRIRGEIYEILEARVEDWSYFGAVGRCLNVNHEGAWIKTKEGFIVVKWLRREGQSERLHAKDVLRIGYRFR